MFTGHLGGSCCPRRAGRGRLHSGHQRAAHGPPQTLGGSTNDQEGQGEHHTDVVSVWPQSSGLMFLVLKYVQNFVKIYKTLVQQCTHASVACINITPLRKISCMKPCHVYIKLCGSELVLLHLCPLHYHL